MNRIVIMPHLDDESFTCGGMLWDHGDSKNRGYIGISSKLSVPIYQSCFDLDSDLLIVTFCKGRKEDANFKDRIKTFKSFCVAVNANYIILDFYDLELYKNPVNYYVDILYKIFDSIRLNKTSKTFDVYIPSENDLHQEHRLVSQTAKIVLRKYLDKINQILEFKQPFENFDQSEYNHIYECEWKAKELFCKSYHETQPLYYDKEYYRIIYSRL